MHVYDGLASAKRVTSERPYLCHLPACKPVVHVVMGQQHSIQLLPVMGLVALQPQQLCNGEAGDLQRQTAVGAVAVVVALRHERTWCSRFSVRHWADYWAD
jgi:hypothetical protein